MCLDVLLSDGDGFASLNPFYGLACFPPCMMGGAKAKPISGHPGLAASLLRAFLGGTEMSQIERLLAQMSVLPRPCQPAVHCIAD